MKEKRKNFGEKKRKKERNSWGSKSNSYSKDLLNTLMGTFLLRMKALVRSKISV